MADPISTRTSLSKEDEETISRNGRKRKALNRGAWTSDEDRRLAQVIENNGPRRWKSVALKAGINRCGKSCRLRWMNYLRPNIKRGNISDQEEDLILRLHKLLGNRWSLIAGRLPGRTDNEIKNYWNSYLSKKIKRDGSGEKSRRANSSEKPARIKKCNENESKEKMEVKSKSNIQEENSKDSEIDFNVDEFFDFSNENPSNLEWLSSFLQLDGKISCQFS
ncbi:hypothetical protein V2J09_005832 [Rumex salicifolius]